MMQKQRSLNNKNKALLVLISIEKQTNSGFLTS